MVFFYGWNNVINYFKNIMVKDFNKNSIVLYNKNVVIYYYLFLKNMMRINVYRY